MKRIALLGSTGSIGRQTLEVVETMGYTITALTANRSVELLEAQCRKFRPRLAVCMDPEAAETLKIKLADTCVEVRSGMDGLLAAAGDEDTDVVLTAVMGMVGLRPTLAALKKGRRAALANKETLVCAGELVMETGGTEGRSFPLIRSTRPFFSAFRAIGTGERSSGSLSRPLGGLSLERQSRNWRGSRFRMR